MRKIEVTIDSHQALLTINNPPANTWDGASLTLLRDTVAELNDSREIYALVLTGQGDKFFSAGADLNMFADGDMANARRMAVEFSSAFETLSQFRGVSIAAINGFAMGGGLEAAMCCDIRIVESQAQMGLPEATVGLLPGGLGTQHLSWLVGEGWAKRMILLGERVDAETAKAIGLVEEVVPTGESLSRAREMATMAENQSPTSIAACKHLIQSARHRAMSEGYILERDAFVDLFSTEDQKEGVNAFLEKRKPAWKNS